MKDKSVFISYADVDRRKVEIFRDELSKSGYKPVIVAESKEPLEQLTEKVAKGIKKSKYFVPILTRESIAAQWINQEIGFAHATGDCAVIPIVEKNIMDRLKGFIHKEVDIPFCYNALPNNLRQENKNFKKCILELIAHLEEERKREWFL